MELYVIIDYKEYRESKMEIKKNYQVRKWTGRQDYSDNDKAGNVSLPFNLMQQGHENLQFSYCLVMTVFYCILVSRLIALVFFLV